jgi:hypothetical protein
LNKAKLEQALAELQIALSLAARLEDRTILSKITSAQRLIREAISNAR